jgi:hypothetical protein
MYYRNLLYIAFFVLVGLFSCKKYEDTKGVHDPRLDSTYYCNDPAAVNYNWGFPGIPKDSLCFYPTDVFSGTYLFKDSIYTPEGLAPVMILPLTLNMYKLTKTNLRVTGFCPSGDSLRFTVDRYYKAYGDTTVVSGQTFCNIVDTMSGTMTKYNTNDTILYVDFTVVSDTGTTYHRGTAYKQF